MPHPAREPRTALSVARQGFTSSVQLCILVPPPQLQARSPASVPSCVPASQDFRPPPIPVRPPSSLQLLFLQQATQYLLPLRYFVPRALPILQSSHDRIHFHSFSPRAAYIDVCT